MIRNGKILIVATMLFLIGNNPFLFGQEGNSVAGGVRIQRAKDQTLDKHIWQN